jgi:hypothetical protein
MTKTPDTTPQPNYPDQITGDKPQPGAEHAENAVINAADLRGMDSARAQPVEALLFEHDDGRYAVNPDTTNEPAWHRVGPVQVYGPAAQPARECLQQSERNALDGLFAVAAAAFHCADDSEDDGSDTIKVQPADMTALGKALDLLDALPDDQPGYSMGPAAKAQWALRNLQAAPPAPQGEKVYAALPESAGDSVDFGNGNIDIDWGHPAPAGGTSLYTADQMRTFADATAALRASAAPPAPAGVAVPASQVDAIGAALDLEGRAKTVESQTTERAMLHAANCLRLLAAAPASTSDTESVLIDGIAYEVPAAVAAELLSLHLDLLAAAPAQAVAWMTPEGGRVVTEATMASARKDGGAMLSSMRPFSVALGKIAAPGQEHATQLAGQGQAVPQIPPRWLSDQCGGEYDDMTSGQGYRKGWNDCRDAMRAAAPIQAQEDARDTTQAIDAAAKAIAKGMDYPWEHMTKEGHANMHEVAATALATARAAQGGAA